MSKTRDGVPGISGKESKSKTNFMEEEEAHPSIQGVLSIRVNGANKLTCEDFRGQPHNVYVEISVRELVKRTKVVQNPASMDPIWDQLKHFPVQVIRNRKHPFNMVSLEVKAFESDNPGRVVQLGSIAFHLHDVVGYSPVRGIFDVFKGHIIVGELSLDLFFAYGLFGYGYSPQLKDDFKSVEEHLMYSLYPRIDPPLDRQESIRQSLIPKAVLHPPYLDFNQKVHLGYGQRVQTLLEQTTIAPEFPELSKAMGRYKDLVGQYRSIKPDGSGGLRRKRLNFLLRQVVANTIKEETSSEKPVSTAAFGTPSKPRPPKLGILQPATAAASIGLRMQEHHEHAAAKRDVDRESTPTPKGIGHTRNASMYTLHYVRAVEAGKLSDANSEKERSKQAAVQEHTADRISARRVNRQRRRTLHSRAAASMANMDHLDMGSDSSPSIQVSAKHASSHGRGGSQMSPEDSGNHLGLSRHQQHRLSFQEGSSQQRIQEKRLSMSLGGSQGSPASRSFNDSSPHLPVVPENSMDPRAYQSSPGGSLGAGGVEPSGQHSAIARALALKQQRRSGGSGLAVQTSADMSRPSLSGQNDETPPSPSYSTA